MNFLSKAMANGDARLGSSQTGVSELFSGCCGGGRLGGNMKLLWNQEEADMGPWREKQKAGEGCLEGAEATHCG